MFKFKIKGLKIVNLTLLNLLSFIHFKYYIILLLIFTIIIVFFYLNNKYPNKLYVQDIYFDEHISSVMHNEILSPSSTRVLELISFKYNELYQTDKKITSLIEKNFIQEIIIKMKKTYLI